MFKKTAKCKKLLAMVLVCVIVVSAFPLTASANPTSWCLTHKKTGCTHCVGHTIKGVGTATATCTDPGGGIGYCMTSGCGHTFYQYAPLEHNHTTSKRVCTRVASCGAVLGSSTGWHYVFRAGNLATKVTEGYPAYNSGGLHEGIDIVHDSSPVDNMPVYAVEKGTVHSTEWVTGYGNTVVLNIGSNKVWFAHLKDNTTSVNAGNSVTESRLLARVGATGGNYSSHLHFELRASNNAKNTGAAGFDPRSYYPSVGVFT